MRPIHIAGVLAIALIWGASFLFVAVLVRELSPLAIAWTRLGGGAVVILAMAAVRRTPVPRSGRYWRDVVFVSVFASTIPFILIPLGQQEVASSLAAILNSSVPIWTAAFAFILLPTERLSRLRIAGLALGFVGVAVVIGRSGLALDGAAARGQLAILGAAACYGVGAVYFRRTLIGRDSTLIAGAQSAIGFVMLTPVVIATGTVPHVSTLATVTLLAAAGLSVLCSGVAIIIYYWLLHEVTAAQATTSTYLIPVTAIFWGWAVLDEQLSWTVIPGLALIILGVWLLNRAAPAARVVEAAA